MIFDENFEVGSYIKKAWHFALCDVFIYKKLDTSQKAWQFALLFNTKPGHFALRNFSLNFWNGWRGGHIFTYKKYFTLRYIFILKNSALSVPFIYKKSKTLCVTFWCAKNIALRVTILYQKFIVWYWYLSINARTIRSIRSKHKSELLIENWSYSHDKQMVLIHNREGELMEHLGMYHVYMSTMYGYPYYTSSNDFDTDYSI